jgi:ribosomal protein L11 methyltransferase
MTDDRTQAGVYIEARLELPRDVADIVCDFIVENISPGLVLEDEEDSENLGIVFYVRTDAESEYRPVLEAFLERFVGQGIDKLPTIRERTIRDVQWEENYKQSVRPLLIAGDVGVRPPWAEPIEGSRYDVILEPRMAFGTGTHETTRSCLKVIRETFEPGQRFLDLGCGSGILSILAAKMGAAYIKAVDYDLTAVDNCTENFMVNGITTRHEVLFGSIEKAQQDEPYDFVCVNIIKATILPVLPRLRKLTRPGGKLVLSGLLAREEEEVSGRLHELDLVNYVIVPDNEWITYVITPMAGSVEL